MATAVSSGNFNLASVPGYTSQNYTDPNSASGYASQNYANQTTDPNSATGYASQNYANQATGYASQNYTNQVQTQATGYASQTNASYNKMADNALANTVSLAKASTGKNENYDSSPNKKEVLMGTLDHTKVVAGGSKSRTVFSPENNRDIPVLDIALNYMYPSGPGKLMWKVAGKTLRGITKKESVLKDENGNVTATKEKYSFGIEMDPDDPNVKLMQADLDQLETAVAKILQHYGIKFKKPDMSLEVAKSIIYPMVWNFTPEGDETTSTVTPKLFPDIYDVMMPGINGRQPYHYVTKFHIPWCNVDPKTGKNMPVEWSYLTDRQFEFEGLIGISGIVISNQRCKIRFSLHEAYTTTPPVASSNSSRLEDDIARFQLENSSKREQFLAAYTQTPAEPEHPSTSEASKKAPTTNANKKEESTSDASTNPILGQNIQELE